VRLVGLDTLRDGFHDGELDPRRLAWLDDQLGRAPATPTIVFMHHPAFATGIWWMDATPLVGRDDFWAVIARHPQVVQVVAGHVHHHASTTVGSTACSTAPGTSYQLVLELDPEASPKISDRAGAVLLHDVTGESCVVHESPYLTDGDTVLDFARIVGDYPAFVAKLRSGTGLAKDGFGM
jgi:Icc protein